jgi:hypothetical protein
MIREFARFLVPGAVAGFAESGPRHSESARSAFESGTFRVVEHDVDVHALGGRPKPQDSPRSACASFISPRYQVSLAEYEDLLTGGPASSRWLDSTRTFRHLVRNFVLAKAGELRADSRTAQGLACEIRLAETPVRAPAGTAITIAVTVTNTGRG